MKITVIAKSTLINEVKELFDAREDQLKGTDAEAITEIAGRICYDSFGSGRSSLDYHSHIAMVGHGSVLEHATVTLLIQRVSRSLTHELVRHRVGTAISQRSTRYCDETDSPVIHHPLVVKALSNCEARDLADFKEEIGYASFQNRKLYNSIYRLVNEYLIESGVDKPTAKKQARGAARQYLENGLDTELIWTVNMRSMLNIIRQRGSLAADAEIRSFAVELCRIGKQLAPAYFGAIEIKVDHALGEYIDDCKSF
jgi:thymidylate synthase (FAD)